MKKSTTRKRTKDMTYVIAISNEKGGVAKTTTTISLGAALTEVNRKVLLVDLDPQANLTLALGINPASAVVTSSHILIESAPLMGAKVGTEVEHLDLIPSNASIENAEQFLSVRPNYSLTLKQALDNAAPLPYDYIILDCPPFLGTFTTNALSAADLLIIPTQAEYFSAYALRNMMGMIRRVRQECNPGLAYRILITMLDRINWAQHNIQEQLQFKYGEGLLKTMIEVDMNLRESAIAGLPITFYKPNAPGSIQYRELAQEIIKNVNTNDQQKVQLLISANNTIKTPEQTFVSPAVTPGPGQTKANSREPFEQVDRQGNHVSMPVSYPPETLKQAFIPPTITPGPGQTKANSHKLFEQVDRQSNQASAPVGYPAEASKQAFVSPTATPGPGQTKANIRELFEQVDRQGNHASMPVSYPAKAPKQAFIQPAAIPRLGQTNISSSELKGSPVRQNNQLLAPIVALGFWLILSGLGSSLWIPSNTRILALALLAFAVTSAITNLFRFSRWIATALAILIYGFAEIGLNSLSSDVILPVVIFSAGLVITTFLASMVGREALSMARQLDSNEKLINELRVFDPDTGAMRYYQAVQLLKSEIIRSRRYERNLCVLLIQINNLDVIEKQSGEIGVEETKRQAVDALMNSVRTIDIPFSGEKFGVFLPETDLYGAKTVIDRLSIALVNKARISASIGIAEFPQDGISETELVEAAEAAMQIAVTSGKPFVQYCQINKAV